MKTEPYKYETLKPEIVHLLRRVQNILRRRKGQFYMGDWKASQEIFELISKDSPDTEPHTIPECGTACCIGGWMSVIDLNKPKKKLKPSEIKFWSIVTRVTEYLTSQPELNKLFYTMNWPYQFRQDVKFLKTNEANAIKRIEHFLKTDGRE